MRRSCHVRHRLLIVVLATAAMVGGYHRPLPAQTGGTLIFGVTPTNRLIAFSTANVGQILNSVAISNLAPGERILGIDFRPVNKRLYALGSSNQLYQVNEITGAAIRIGAPFATALAGTEFGFDFNPTVDRIRVVSNSGQNLRLHPDTGQVVATDGALAYAAGDANFGRAPSVSGVAYTNPDTDPATGTTLFDLDTALDVVSIQNPPNDGALNTLAPLGIDAASVGFDIGLSAFFASIQTAGATSSTLIQMAGPTRTTLGTIGGGEVVPSIAVSLGAAFSPTAERVFAVTGAGELISFSANSASTILSRVAIANLNAGETILGIDFRPANNLLYGLGSSSQLYTIDVQTGFASRVGPPLTTPLNGTEFGFDFNPTVDRIRVVSNSGQNLRLHPETGAVAAVDTPLSFAPGDTNAGRQPRAVGAAYTNPDNNPATGTTLFVIDAGLDLGAVQDPPNAGILNTFATFGADVGDVLSFDISATQILLAVAPNRGAASSLFDVANNARRNLGVIGNGENIRGLAISLGQ
jgi:uncharacterized protein DUF4394